MAPLVRSLDPIFPCKKSMNASKLCLLFSILCLSVLGCNGEAEQAVALRRSNLTELGAAFQAFYGDRGKAPAGVGELSEYMLENSPDDQAIQDAVDSIEARDVQMIWDGVLSDAGDNDKYWLGFEASVPGSGGYIITGGGEVQLVTATQFAEMPVLPVAKASDETLTEDETLSTPAPSASENG